MKIINNTDLSYEQIGEVMDFIIKTSEVDTQYYGKKERLKVNRLSKVIKIQIRYLKRYVEWGFDYE